ncbi:MAG: flagellar protein FlaG [Syntrophales bacterium]|jgi:flagellar protein FlaG|nr:flagellar protein FlaG [Syntrophales bacterium]MDY0043352.1 flagellar protein FlaG [Syntrophales bacterium]
MEAVKGNRVADSVEILEKALSPGISQSSRNNPLGEIRKKEKEETYVPGTDAVREITSMIQDEIDSMNIKIAFSTYGDGDECICIVVKNKETGEIIREIPPEELQRLHGKMEELIGLIFNDRI